jgi:hypothetical protein
MLPCHARVDYPKIGIRRRSFFRDARLNQIGEGSSEVHKSVFGRDVMRRARYVARNPCLRPGSLVGY